MFQWISASYQWKSFDQYKYNILFLAWHTGPFSQRWQTTFLASSSTSECPSILHTSHTCHGPHKQQTLLSLECFSSTLPLATSSSFFKTPYNCNLLRKLLSGFPAPTVPWISYLLVSYNILLNYLLTCLSFPLNSSLPYFIGSSLYKAWTTAGTPYMFVAWLSDAWMNGKLWGTEDQELSGCLIYVILVDLLQHQGNRLCLHGSKLSPDHLSCLSLSW